MMMMQLCILSAVRLERMIREYSFAATTQKCNKTANVNVKKTAVYTQVNGEWHLKLQKSQKGDITQQHTDI